MATKRSALLWALGTILAGAGWMPRAQAGGVTVVTHGLNGNADGWVSGMAGQIPNYASFEGATHTFYKIYFYYSGGFYYPTWSRVSGSAPTNTDSGEILVAFDWSQLADGNSYDTYQIAPVLASVLQSTNFIPEMGGHALAELPLHLIGHSRGGSLMCEASRVLGTNGCWVDHLTTLDPHPLNDAAFPLDWILYSNIDAPAQTYQNVVFHDNYWQNLDTFVYGKSVPGAYIRKLINLSGGYSSSHSDVHLWYHGTVDERNPASDTEAQLTSSEFGSWYSAYENYSYQAGFRWSLIGGGNRASFDQPEGVGFPAIRDGYNQSWNLGIGLPQSANRTTLGAIKGNWPSLIRLNLLNASPAQQGTNLLFSLYYQWAQVAASNATLRLYLDDDFNPFNGNSHPILQGNATGTGTAGMSISYWDSFSPLSATLNGTNAPVGYHSIYAAISGGGKTRYLYAPEIIQVLPAIILNAQAGDRTVVAGSNVTFAVTATGVATLRYQWRTNGVNIAGATNAAYNIVNVLTNRAGNYSVIVSNAFGSAVSSNALLTVLAPPNITTNPTSRVVKVGTGTTFGVTATGTGPLFYQWRKDSGDILDATNSSHVIAVVQTNDAGVYSAIVSNLAGTAISSNAVLTVTVPPGITDQPQSLTVVRGSNVLFSVTATGTTPLRYQWRSNAVNIVNATNASYAISNVQTNHAASYSVRVTNIAGSVTSAVASLTVLVPPAVTVQATNRAVKLGTNTTFAVTATGTAPLFYQWRKDGGDIGNATNNSYQIPVVQTNDAGAYSIVVSNTAGVATSSNAMLVVNVPPSISVQPESQMVVRGSNATFSVTALGTLPLKYRWRSNAVYVASATNATFTITNAQTNAVASYSVVITNVAGSVTSAVASLTVLVPPALATQPTNRTVFAGSNVTFAATATGTAPLRFQWRKNSLEIPDATNSSFSIVGAQLNDAGSYSVVVTNVAGLMASSNAVLTVNARPGIVTQPLTQSVVIGSDVTFNVVANGTAPLRYQWRKNAVAIGGATNDVHALTSVQTNAAADYTVVVTNNFGSVTSAVATLTVNLTPPVLNFATGAGNVVMSWSTNWPDFTLQSTTNMNLPGSWFSNPPPPVVSGATFVVTNAVSGEQRFYRLKR